MSAARCRVPWRVSGAEEVAGGPDDVAGGDPGGFHEFGGGPGAGQVADREMGDPGGVTRVAEKSACTSLSAEAKSSRRLRCEAAATDLSRTVALPARHGARVCATHQPQHVRVPSAPHPPTPSALGCCCGWSSTQSSEPCRQPFSFFCSKWRVAKMDPLFLRISMYLLSS